MKLHIENKLTAQVHKTWRGGLSLISRDWGKLQAGADPHGKPLTQDLLAPSLWSKAPGSEQYFI